LAVAILASLPPDASAQQSPVMPPDEVARAVLRADSAGDWQTVLRLAHPDALSRFRGRQVFQLRMLGTPAWPATDAAVRDSAGLGTPTADSAGTDSLSPDSTVQARWQRIRGEQQRFMLDSIFQVPDVDSLARTSPDTVYARWVRGMQARSRGDTAAQRPPERPPYRVVGAVKASDTLAYVVMERPLVQPLGPMPELFRDLPRETHTAGIMVMRRHGREWRSMLDGVGESLGLAAGLLHGE
jgi:hypothetical protein